MLSVGESAPEQLLGIFVKEPLVGKVKTRLCPPLQPAEATELYEVALRETVERFTAGTVPVVLFYAGSAEYFQKNFPDLPLWPQTDGDLGQRMTEALSLLLTAGCQAAGLIGSDSPDLPVEQVDAAFSALAGHDVVTVPADDGGYVMIGSSRFCPEVFQGIDWSTGAVSAQTRQRAEQNSISFCEVGGWTDIDDHASLLALLKRTPTSATAHFVREKLQYCLSPTG
jgi:rSAM/selenodomain-associated transferase 1